MIEKWNKFLNKIENRFYSSVSDAKETCLELLEENDYNYNETMRAYTGMKAQIEGLIKKIDTTWDEKVVDKLKEKKLDWVDLLEKKNKLTEKLWEYLREESIKIEGEISLKYYDKVIRLMDEEFLCTQCSAKLEIIKNLYRAQYITCEYCNRVNTFTPSTKVGQLNYGIIENILNLEYFKEKKELEDLCINLKEKAQENKLTLDEWKNYKEKYIEFFKKYFKERIKLNIIYKERYEDDIKRKVEELETEEKYIKLC